MNKQTEQQPEAVKATVDNTNNSNADKAQTEKAKASSTAKPKAGSTSNKSMFIAGLAICIAVIGSGAAIGFTLWKTQHYDSQLAAQNSSLAEQLKEQQSQWQQLNSDAKTQQTLLKNQLATEVAKVKELDNQLATLQASQQNVIAKVAKISVDSSQNWMLFEAKQLLKQAFLRLRVSDINGASKLLEDINTTIKQRGDLSQEASQINQAIETALLKLQQVEQVNRPNLYAQLAALQVQITELEAKKPVFQAQTKQLQGEDVSRWQKLSNTLSNYVRVDFNANNKVLPLLASQGVGQLKMTLSLSIEKAQWAALNGEASIYNAELERTAQLLSQYFDADTSEVAALINKINELKTKTVITKVPDISDTFILINNYLDSQIALRTHANSPKAGGNE